MSKERPMKYSEIHSSILDLYLDGHPDFGYAELYRDLNLETDIEKTYCRRIIGLLVELGKCKKMGRSFHFVETTLREINWQAADTKNTIDLQWPLKLQDHIKTYPKSLYVVAGVTGAGKTAFVYNFVVNNMNNPMGLHLFSSDMDPEEMLEKFNALGVEIPNPAPFKVWERYTDFADVIEPNAINVIDYLKEGAEFYDIKNELEAVHEKLETGVALVTIQKHPERQAGYGGEPTKWKSSAYFNIDPVFVCSSCGMHTTVNGKCQKFKCTGERVWWGRQLEIAKARSRHSNIRIEGKKIGFDLDDGVRFKPVYEGGL